jgi:hypothetical protein
LLHRVIGVFVVASLMSSILPRLASIPQRSRLLDANDILRSEPAVLPGWLARCELRPILFRDHQLPQEIMLGFVPMQ